MSWHEGGETYGKTKVLACELSHEDDPTCAQDESALTHIHQHLEDPSTCV